MGDPMSTNLEDDPQGVRELKLNPVPNGVGSTEVPPTPALFFGIFSYFQAGFSFLSVLRMA